MGLLTPSNGTKEQVWTPQGMREKTTDEMFKSQYSHLKRYPRGTAKEDMEFSPYTMRDVILAIAHKAVILEALPEEFTDRNIELVRLKNPDEVLCIEIDYEAMTITVFHKDAPKKNVEPEHSSLMQRIRSAVRRRLSKLISRSEKNHHSHLDSEQ